MADSITFKTGNILIGFKNAVSKKKKYRNTSSGRPRNSFYCRNTFLPSLTLQFFFNNSDSNVETMLKNLYMRTGALFFISEISGSQGCVYNDSFYVEHENKEVATSDKDVKTWAAAAYLQRFVGGTYVHMYMHATKRQTNIAL
jgi:hypothetical protein